MRSQTTFAASAIPPSQNTAPVLEFRCLYTHDIRRKAKRWQDGFLRFHTFNKRVMVYDAPRNFIGDMHWRESEELQDGDEMTLEKGGVIVQVGESVGVTETDLTPLFQRKDKGTPEKGAEQAARVQPTPSGGNWAAAAPSQLRHKSLNTLLGTPKGAYGRAALPVKSPYEERHGNSENEWENGREAKRQRVGGVNSPPTRNAVKPLRTLKATTNREAPLRARTADAHIDRASNTKMSSHIPSLTGQTRLLAREMIEISSDTEEVSSDAAFKTTPPKIINSVPPPPRWTPARRPAVPSSPPVSTTNRLVNGQSEATLPNLDKDAHSDEPTEVPANAANPRAKILRSVTAAPRKMLLCQNIANQKDATNSNNTKSSADIQRAQESKDRPVSRRGPRWREVALSKPKETSVEEVVEESAHGKEIRAARVDSSSPDAFEIMEPPSENGRGRSSRGDALRKPGKSTEPAKKPVNGLDRPSRKATTKAAQEKSAGTPASLEAMALNHGCMDQRLLNFRTTSHQKAGDARSHYPPTTSEARPFRRVRSENDTLALPDAGIEGDSADILITEPAALPPRKRALAFKSQFQRSRSLTIPPPTKTVIVPATAKKDKKPAVPEVVKDTDVGPWSTEAFDLFDWRPPDRDVNDKENRLDKGEVKAQAGEALDTLVAG